MSRFVRSWSAISRSLPQFAPARRPHARRRLTRPTLMALEDRRLLSTIVVNNPTDMPVTGEIDLRQAIGLANTNGGAESITFDKTVFKTPQTITLSGTQLELSDTTGTETITGPAAGVTINGNGASRVFLVDPNVTASIWGMTITGGYTGNEGGGIDNYGKLTVSNSIFSNNSAFNGGAIEDSSGTLTVNSSIFVNNHAYDAGGGINTYSQGAPGSTVSIVNNSVFSNNTADVGGGINNYGNMTVKGSVFVNNSAEGGGGIGSQGTLTVNSSVFFGNSASTEPGGGIEYIGTLINTNNVFVGNTPNGIGS